MELGGKIKQMRNQKGLTQRKNYSRPVRADQGIYLPAGKRLKQSLHRYPAPTFCRRSGQQSLRNFSPGRGGRKSGCLEKTNTFRERCGGRALEMADSQRAEKICWNPSSWSWRKALPRRPASRTRARNSAERAGRQESPSYLGSKHYICKKGEAFVNYSAGKPHCILNKGKGRARFLWISTPPNF